MSVAGDPPVAVARTVCPECRHVLGVPAAYEARRWRCPDCRTPITPVPDATARYLEPPEAADAPEGPDDPPAPAFFGWGARAAAPPAPQGYPPEPEAIGRVDLSPYRDLAWEAVTAPTRSWLDVALAAALGAASAAVYLRILH